MGADKFSVYVSKDATREHHFKEWDRAEIVQGAAWLKRMNARGFAVEIRPSSSSENNLVLLKNVMAGPAAAMKADGYEPAATVQVSPHLVDVWIKVSDKAVPEQERKAITERLAQKYLASPPRSVDYGRLAGFTAPDDGKQTNGTPRPFALAREYSGRVATSGPDVVLGAELHVDRAQALKQRKPLIEAVMASQQQSSIKDPEAEYRRLAKPMIGKLASPTTEDLKAVDLAVARAMAMAGRTASDIEQGISKASPAVESRQPARIEAYARGVATAATAAPDVLQHRQEQERVQARQAVLDRGRTPDKPRRERDQGYGR